MNIRNLIVLLMCTFFWSGCAANVRVFQRQEGDIKNYKKVYLVKTDPDPRNIEPAVVAELEAMGLDVEVVTDDKDTGGQGTGFFISTDGHLLTCEHVVGDLDVVSLWHGDQRYLADVVAKGIVCG